MGKGQILYKQAKKIIPGGTQLLSKRPEMFLPDFWPAYYDKAKGCEVWDLDGKKYIDASFMGIGSCILGYSDPDVDNHVIAAIKKANITTLNCPEEVELAKLLIDIHKWADMVRFARTGGEAMSIAVRIARAATEKDLVLFCGYHGWHDWYLAANLADDKSLDGHLLPGLEPKGVPRALRKTAIPFKYNDKKAFLALIRRYKNKIAAVVMEPIRNYQLEGDFLETIRKVTRRLKIVLIFDEITSGWRLNAGGVHLKLKVSPDVAVFAKAMSNGYPMAAIIGRKNVMQAAEETFISSTYWTDRIGPVAALATIKKIKRDRIPEYLISIGEKIQKGWKELARKYGLDISVYGIKPLSHFSFNYKEPLVPKTIFTQIMLEEGFLATTSFYSSFAHKDKHIQAYLKAAGRVFSFISYKMRKGNLKNCLKGKVCHSGFKRLA